jgi:hypothetical protein
MSLRTFAAAFSLGLAACSPIVAGQVAGDPGVIEYEGALVQISVQQGHVSIGHQGNRELDAELAELARRIETHLAATEQQEERQFSDMEGLHRGTNYAKKLVAKIELLIERIGHLGNDSDFGDDISASAAAFDVPRIKSLLQDKLSLEDDNVAEAAFQLAGFQELDGEYQDAWGNYQKASNLEPDNQLYMDAHGKNEF